MWYYDDDDDNTVGVLWFLFVHLFGGWMGYILFTGKLFCRIISPLTGKLMTTRASLTVLLVLTIVCITGGCLLTIWNHRNDRSVCFNVSAPFGIYLVLETLPNVPIYLWVGAAIWVVCAVWYGVVLVRAPIRRRKNTGRVVRKRAAQFLYHTGSLAGAMLTLLAAVCLVGALTGFTVIHPEKSWDLADARDMNYTLAQYEGELMDLQTGRWDDLTLQERVDLMQLIADIEANYLGLPDSVPVRCDNIDPYTMGSYDPNEAWITLQRDHLLYGSVEDCVDSILHEVRHAYQRLLCTLYEEVDERYRSMYALRDATIFAYEFEHYNRGVQDFDDYYDQYCESDARAYAGTRIEEYRALRCVDW